MSEIPTSALVSLAGAGLFVAAPAVPEAYRSGTRMTGGVLIGIGLIMGAGEILEWLGLKTKPEAPPVSVEPSTPSDPSDPGRILAQIVSPGEGQTINSPGIGSRYPIVVELTSTRRKVERHRVQVSAATSFTLASDATVLTDLGVLTFTPGSPLRVPKNLELGTTDYFVLFPPTVEATVLVDGVVSSTAHYQVG